MKKNLVKIMSLTLAGVLTFGTTVSVAAAQQSENIRVQGKFAAPTIKIERENLAFIDNKILELLDVTEEQLREQLQNDNLFTILENSGKLEEYKEFMKTRHQERIEHMLAEDKITEKEADEMLKSFEEFMQDLNGENIKDFKIGFKRLNHTDVFADDELLELLNVTGEELKELLQSNDFYTVINNLGKLEEYKEFMKTRHQERIEHMLAEDKITEKEADEMLKSFEEFIQDLNGENIKDFKIGFKRLNHTDVFADDELLELLNVTGEELKELLQSNDFYTVINNLGKLEEYKEFMKTAKKDRIDFMLTHETIIQE